MRACWLKWVGRDWSISADYIWLNYSGANNQKEDEGRRDLPGRQFGPHAGDGEAEVHSGARVEQEEVPGHVEAGGDGRAEGKAEG